MACCGDTPTLEILAAVSILRQHLPDLKIRVINVVDLMKLQPSTEHPHGPLFAAMGGSHAATAKRHAALDLPGGDSSRQGRR
jgi:phosphoketolase